MNFADALPFGAPEHDPQLSDWLLGLLNRDLMSTGAVFRRVDDNRSGEGLSVRFAFWLLDLDRIVANINSYWKVLAVQRFSDLFQTPAHELLDRAVVSRYHQIVHNAPEGDPVGLSACPQCGSTDLEYESFSNGEDTIFEVTCKECSYKELLRKAQVQSAGQLSTENWPIEPWSSRCAFAPHKRFNQRHWTFYVQFESLEITSIEQAARVQLRPRIKELFRYVVNHKEAINQLVAPPRPSHRCQAVQQEQGLFVCGELRSDGSHMLHHIAFRRCASLDKSH